MSDSMDGWFAYGRKPRKPEDQLPADADGLATVMKWVVIVFFFFGGWLALR